MEGGGTITANKATGKISTDKVTGDIVITAKATLIPVVVKTNFFKATPTVNTTATASQDAMIIGGRLGSDSAYRVDGGPDCLMSSYISIQNGDIISIGNATIHGSLNSGLFLAVGDAKATAMFNPSNANGVSAISSTGFTINHTSAKYVRITLKPDTSIRVNSSANTVDARYDCSKIVVNIKRNGVDL